MDKITGGRTRRKNVMKILAMTNAVAVLLPHPIEEGVHNNATPILTTAVPQNFKTKH